MTWIEEIKQAFGNEGQQLTREWLEHVQSQAPYSVLPALLFLKANGVKGNEDVLARLSISFPDRQALSLVLGDDADDFAHFLTPVSFNG